MLSDLIFSLNVVLPLFLCCVVGFLARKFHIVDAAFLSGCSQVVFYLAIPANIFCSIVNSGLDESFSFPLLVFLLVTILSLWMILSIAVPKVIKDCPTSATVATSMFRSNFAMLGIPLAISLMGTEGAAPTMIMVPFATLLYTVLTVEMLSRMGASQTGDRWASIRSTALEVLKNPLIIASLASILVAWLHVPLPSFLEATIERYADMCTGLSLFMLGAQLDFRKFLGRLQYIIPIAAARLIIIPLTVVSIGAALGFRGGELACVFIFFAAPTAVNCYILAGRMGGDGELAGDTVLATSCFSTITLTVGIFLLRTLQLL